jgi:hypothetical protein
MIRLMVILLLLLPGIAQAEAPKRSIVYKIDAVLIVLDGVTTSRGIHNGAREVGFPKLIIGEYPSDLKIAAWTAANLAILEWSQYWPKRWREPFQNVTLVVRSGVVLWNYRVSIQ